MKRLAETYPGYGFEIHKGYPTPAHQAALKRLGPCPEHRRSFAPVAQMELSLWDEVQSCDEAKTEAEQEV